MKYKLAYLGKQINFFTKSLMIIMFILSMIIKFILSYSNIHSSLQNLPLEGHFSFDKLDRASKDFGGVYSHQPVAVLHPRSVSDIAVTIRYVWQLGQGSGLTVAARGRGHSVQGQAQAQQGIVIDMRSLRDYPIKVYPGECSYVDVSGGELWINILHESLKYGLAPKSWTDYLHLSVGGTLSNAGVSGQAFKHGPQVSNVYQLEVVTGKGEVVNCSKKQNAELFHSVLGGLGQFGIITRARIALERSPTMVKWIRVLYLDMDKFTRDQEHLISRESTFDYIEGFVIINRTGLLNNWRSSFNPQDPVQAAHFNSDGKILYCLEVAKYFNPEDADIATQETEKILSEISFIKSTVFIKEATYVEFLERVHVSEMKLRRQGVWEVAHPWLNLLIPKTQIHSFAHHVFGYILKDSSSGPILIYPLNKSKWDNKTSVVIPEEDIFYLVAFLSSAVPHSTGIDGLDSILTRNRGILDFCKASLPGVKQYLPHYTTQEGWQAHFGPRWEVIEQRKATYDPLAILAPGQMIFQQSVSSS